MTKLLKETAAYMATQTNERVLAMSINDIAKECQLNEKNSIEFNKYYSALFTKSAEKVSKALCGYEDADESMVVSVYCEALFNCLKDWDGSNQFTTLFYVYIRRLLNSKVSSYIKREKRRTQRFNILKVYMNSGNIITDNKKAVLKRIKELKGLDKKERIILMAAALEYSYSDVINKFNIKAAEYQKLIKSIRSKYVLGDIL